MGSTVFENPSEERAVCFTIPPSCRHLLLFHVRHPDIKVPENMVAQEKPLLQSPGRSVAGLGRVFSRVLPDVSTLEDRVSMLTDHLLLQVVKHSHPQQHSAAEEREKL